MPVCCYTHLEPSVAGCGGQLAAAESLRCRCRCGAGGGPRCVRQATQEDLLCDRCREPEPGPSAYGEDAGRYAPGRSGPARGLPGP